MKNYPYYLKTICHFSKIVSDNQMIHITNGSDFVGNGIQEFGYLIDLSVFKPSTESEFLDAYNDVRNKLEELATK